MKKLLKITGIATLAVGAAWTFLTFFAERVGPKRSWRMGSQTAKKRALIIYDPDPFYNLDEQVSRSFGQALADQGMRVTVATVAAAELYAHQPIDLCIYWSQTFYMFLATALIFVALLPTVKNAYRSKSYPITL